MGQAPLFTVVLPTHCRPDVISFAIASVLGQSCGDFELLVAGDGAVEGTAAAVTSCDDARVRWFDLPKAPGYGYRNRNTVLTEARGRYIAFMADDNLLLPNHLAELKKLLDSGAALACTRAAWVSTDGIAAPFPTNLELPDERAIFLTRQNSTPANCFAYRAEVAPSREVWPEQELKAGDWRLWQKLINANPGHPLACSREYTVLHFSARRKNARDSHMMEMRRLLEFADQSSWWPDALRAPAYPGSTEQERWYSRMREKGDAFTEYLNQALRLTTDRLAWEYIQSAVPGHLRKLEVQPPKAVLPDDFEPELYLTLNPDVAKAGVDPVYHWMVAGYFEGRLYKKSEW